MLLRMLSITLRVLNKSELLYLCFYSQEKFMTKDSKSFYQEKVLMRFLEAIYTSTMLQMRMNIIEN
jgi:hypothetical protein